MMKKNDLLAVNATAVQMALILLVESGALYCILWVSLCLQSIFHCFCGSVASTSDILTYGNYANADSDHVVPVNWDGKRLPHHGLHPSSRLRTCLH